MSIIFYSNLNDKLSNINIFELLFLLLITLILLSKNLDENKIALYDCEISVFSFKNCKKLFLSNILLLFITFFKLF